MSAFAAAAATAIRWPDIFGLCAILFFQMLFLGFAAMRALYLRISSPCDHPLADPEIWPRYTVLAALYDEAEVVGQLIDHLVRLDYPSDRIEILILLEERDLDTITAAQATTRPAWVRIVVVPPGTPKTKPRALTFGLNQASGELVTVYDAEDKPGPGQLREAAARFAGDLDRTLGCLQAPLRIRPPTEAHRRTWFMDAQFAMEYAALFEVTLPAMTRLGLPFPLGGTSNHFRAEALRDVRGWDPFNVTEDADLGFRLWRHGWRSEMIRTPTYETPPGDMYAWLPQRTSCVPLFARRQPGAFAGYPAGYETVAIR